VPDLGLSPSPLFLSFFLSSLSAPLFATATTTASTPHPPLTFVSVSSPFQVVVTGENYDTVFVFGGCGAEGRLADLHVGHVKEGTVTWKICPAPPAACRGRGGAGLVHLPGFVVVLAGFAGEEMADMYLYNIATTEWKEVVLSGDAFTPRSVFAIAAIGPTTAMVFGGEVGESARGHEGAGDFAADTLTVDLDGVVKVQKGALGGAPPARGWAACDRAENSMVLVGGLAGNDADPIRLADAWVGSL
jgi:hypothetical protein